MFYGFCFPLSLGRRQWQVTEFKYAKAASAIDLKKQQFFSSKERPELDPALSALIGEDIKKSIDAKRSAELDYVPTTDNPVLTTLKSLRRNGAADDTVVVDSIAGSSSEKKQVHTKTHAQKSHLEKIGIKLRAKKTHRNSLRNAQEQTCIYFECKRRRRLARQRHKELKNLISNILKNLNQFIKFNVDSIRNVVFFAPSLHFFCAVGFSRNEARRQARALHRIYFTSERKKV